MRFDDISSGHYTERGISTITERMLALIVPQSQRNRKAFCTNLKGPDMAGRQGVMITSELSSRISSVTDSLDV